MRQHQPGLADDDAAAGALLAERSRGEGVGGDLRLDIDHRAQREVEVELHFVRPRLLRVRHFPSRLVDHCGLITLRLAVR